MTKGRLPFPLTLGIHAHLIVIDSSLRRWYKSWSLQQDLVRNQGIPTEWLFLTGVS